VQFEVERDSDGTTLPVYDKPEQQAWRHWAIGLACSQAKAPRQDDARRHAEISKP
jgi:hypothetical protein